MEAGFFLLFFFLAPLGGAGALLAGRMSFPFIMFLSLVKGGPSELEFPSDDTICRVGLLLIAAFSWGCSVIRLAELGCAITGVVAILALDVTCPVLEVTVLA